MLQAQTPFIPWTAFEREQYGKAKSEGKAEAVLAVLAARRLVVTEEQRQRLFSCTDATKLDRLIARAVSARSVKVLLTDL